MKYIISFLIYLVPLPALTQNFDTITVGSVLADFEQFNDLTNYLEVNGIEKATLIQIYDGEYLGMELDSVSGNNLENVIQFEPLSGDTTTVVFKNMLRFNHLKAIEFCGINVDQNNTEPAALYLNHTIHTSIKNCTFKQTIVEDITYKQSVIFWDLFFEIYNEEGQSINVSNSSLIAGEKQDILEGDFQSHHPTFIRFEHSFLKGGFNDYSPNLMQYCHIVADKGITIGNSEYVSSLNYIYQQDYFIHNHVENLLPFEDSSISARVIKKNLFTGNFTISGDTVVQNKIDNVQNVLGDFIAFNTINTLKGVSAKRFSSNIVNNGATIIRGTTEHFNIIDGNIFKDRIYSENNGYIFINNHFYHQWDAVIGQNIYIYHNNFSPKASFFTQIASVECRNNILAGFNLQYQNDPPFGNNNYLIADTINNNLSMAYDESFYVYPPHYLNKDTALFSQNLQLFGKSKVFDLENEQYFDVSGQIRTSYQTLGANELANFQSFVQDTVYLICGDSLSVPTKTDTGEEIFFTVNEQVVCSENSTSEFCTFRFPTPSLLVANTSNNILDSIWLIPIDSITNQYFFYESACGFEFSLPLPIPSNTESISWSSSLPTNISNPNTYHPSVTPTDTTVFVAELNLGSCGFRYDTVELAVSPHPAAIFEIIYYEYDSVGLINYSFCANSVLLDYGDGTTYDYFQDGHTYTTSGNYDITLIVNNEGIADTFIQSIFIDIIDNVKDIEHREINLKILPNPAKNLIKLQFTPKNNFSTDIQILDVHGRIVKDISLPSSKSTIDISSLGNGFYWLKAIINDQLFKTSFFKI